MPDSRERYDNVIRTAMDRGPEYIHSLWEDYFDHSAAGVHEGARRQLGILEHVRNYSPAILQQAEQRFPKANLTGSFNVPAGFVQKKGLLTSLFSRDVPVELRKANSLTKIKLSRPLSTDMRFPWQLALAANEYLKKSKGQLLSSRYLQVRGSTAYEMCYIVPHAVSLDKVLQPDHPDFLAALKRAEMAVVCNPNAVVRALLETRSLEEDGSSFDAFVQSLK